MSKKNDSPSLREMFESKKRLIEANNQDYRRRIGQASGRVRQLVGHCRNGIDQVFAEKGLIEGRHVIFRSDRDLTELAVTRDETKQAAALLRHPAQGYQVRASARLVDGRETYFIHYRHNTEV